MRIVARGAERAGAGADDAAASPLPIPRVVKRNTLFLAAAQACVGIGNQMTPTLGALMVIHLLGSATFAGAASGIMGGCRLISSYPTGQISDAYGRKAGLFVGLVFSMIGSTIVGLGMTRESPALFFAGLVVFGIGVGAVQQLRIAAADMYPPSRRAEGLGYVLTGSLIGAFGGPALISAAQASAPSLQLAPEALAWFLVPLVLVPTAVLVFLVRPDPREIAAHLERYYPGYRPPERAPGGAVAAPRVKVREYFAHYPRRVAFVTSFALFGNMSMMMAMNAVALAHHGHGLPAISLSVAIHIIGMYGFSLPLGRLADAVGRRNVMLLGLVAAATGGTLVPTAAEYWIVTAGTFLVGFGWSCGNVAIVALIADTTPPLARGRAVGVNDMIAGSASISLPVLAGPLVELAGLPSLAVVSALLMVGPLLLLLRLREPSPGHYAHSVADHATAAPRAAVRVPPVERL
ncbi:MAG TPA: MFS transporter [Chloroflexota bacterium]|nr:MFS transporter [Chloroflexota bacterium]